MILSTTTCKVVAFQIPSSSPIAHSTAATTRTLINTHNNNRIEVLLAAKKGKNKNRSGKGFASPTSDEISSKAAAKAAAQSAMASQSTQSYQKQLQKEIANRKDDRDDDLKIIETQDNDSSMTGGKKLLEQMRREQAEKKDAELRRVKELRETEQMLQSTPDAAAIPEKVAMRMGKRMLPFVGIPLFGSMATFIAFWYFATYKDLEFQPGLVATTTIVILVSGLLVCFIYMSNCFIIMLLRERKEKIFFVLFIRTHLTILFYSIFFLSLSLTYILTNLSLLL